jgi:hypothetical protein
MNSIFSYCYSGSYLREFFAELGSSQAARAISHDIIDQAAWRAIEVDTKPGEFT